jgi:hypothetical protein
MQENEKEMSNILNKGKEFFKSWRFWKPFIALVIGGLAGFLYYYFIGCDSGSCGITSDPYMSMVWGGLLGLFLVNSPCSSGRC